VAGPHAVHLRSSHSIHERDGRLQSHFTLQAGESAVFTATYGASHLPDPDTVNADAALRATVQAWSRWSADSRYEGGWQDAVERSLITIKALIYRPTGGVIAAPRMPATGRKRRPGATGCCGPLPARRTNFNRCTD